MNANRPARATHSPLPRKIGPGLTWLRLDADASVSWLEALT